MTSTPSLLSRLRAVFSRGETDGRLRASINATDAVALVRDGAALLDVREQHEWRAGRAPQAIHVPLGQLDRAPQRLPKASPVLVVCASGMRSRTAAKRLRSLGFDAASISGGMTAWENAGGNVRR